MTSSVAMSSACDGEVLLEWLMKGVASRMTEHDELFHASLRFVLRSLRVSSAWSRPRSKWLTTVVCRDDRRTTVCTTKWNQKVAVPAGDVVWWRSVAYWSSLPYSFYHSLDSLHSSSSTPSLERTSSDNWTNRQQWKAKDKIWGLMVVVFGQLEQQTTMESEGQDLRFDGCRLRTTGATDNNGKRRTRSEVWRLSSSDSWKPGLRTLKNYR